MTISGSGEELTEPRLQDSRFQSLGNSLEYLGLSKAISESPTLNKEDWQAINCIYQIDPEPASSNDLQKALGISRSTILKIAKKLSSAGVLIQRIKPGTENRIYPPYVFSLNPAVRSEVIRILGQPSLANSTVVEDLVSETTENGLNKRSSTTEPLTEISGKPHSNTNSEDKLVFALKKMAQEIADLKRRVTQLERQIEEPSANSKTSLPELDQILDILNISAN